MDFNQDEGDYGVKCVTFEKLKLENRKMDVVNHVISGCIQCCTSRSNFSTREMLYPNAPPPWIQITEEEKANPKAWEKYKTPNKRIFLSEEDINEYLENLECGDEKLVYEITRHLKVDRTEAWKIAHKIRRKRTEKAKQKLKLEKEEARRRAALDRELLKLKKADQKRELSEKRQFQEEQLTELKEKLLMDEKMLKEELEGGVEEESNEDEEEDAQPQTKKNNLNVKSMLPWAPNVCDILCIDKRSKLDYNEQKRITAMCQNLMYQGDFQHASNKQEFKDIMKAIEDEYNAIVEAALEWARKELIFPLDTKFSKLTKRCLTTWRRRAPIEKSVLVSKILHQFDFGKDDSMRVNGENNAVVPQLVKCLQNGKSDTIKIPDMTRKAPITRKFHKLSKEKLPIHLDLNAVQHVLDSDNVSIMMDATTACHFLTPFWESHSYDFSVLINISEQEHNNKINRIISLSKPNPCYSATSATILRSSAKRIIHKDFVVECPENQNLSWKNEIAKRKNIVVESELQVDEEADLNIVDDQEPSTSTADDPLSSIFADIEKMNKTSKLSSISTNGDKMHTGYQYAVFRIGEVDILIRSRPPFNVAYPENNTEKGVHCAIKNQRISFEPRMEYLPNAGAMELGTEEWIWNYLKKTFKMSTAHVLFRVHYQLDQLLQIDACTMRDKNTSARPPNAFSLLSSRTLKFEEFLKCLLNLDCGEYLAYQEQEKPLRITPVFNEETPGATPGYLFELKPDQCSTLADIPDLHYFNGFSPEVLLQWQIMQTKAPRSFLAEDSPVVKNLPARTSIQHANKSKKVIKAKIQKMNQHRPRNPGMIDLDDPSLEIDFTNASYLRNMTFENRDSPLKTRNDRFKRGKSRGQARNRGRGQRGRKAVKVET
ncbi:unnamed protein product [Caenorhabditis bovis]|uniref:Little elongation complex subunit 2 C-terminal domain-containing protein n=1 Tax=Caenorhabditis bovis TaxID=2654633 RepID=A0A8S1ES03_9PELO|nr:unnamed protein product [Caenorhabditis bovis]